MESLGTKNTRENILVSAGKISRALLSTVQITDDNVNDLLIVLNEIIISNDPNIVFSGEVSALLLIIEDRMQDIAIPIIRDIALELKMKIIRLKCVPGIIGVEPEGTSNNSLKPSDCSLPMGSPRTPGTGSLDEREQFTPTEFDNFILPPAGQTTNLTVTSPNPITGKNLIRELIIDSKGYVQSEVSRRYEDVFTDESESIYLGTYIDALNKIKNGNATDTSTDTIKEAEKNCIGAGSKEKSTLGNRVK